MKGQPFDRGDLHRPWITYGKGLTSLNMDGARKSGTTKRRRSGGPRRACANCGRMNHVALKVCRCGRVL